MQIDRELQQKVLILLKERYPENVTDEDFEKMLSLAEFDQKHLIGNMRYLEESGHIKLGMTDETDIYSVNISAISITNDGIDFLEADGGLSAIKNTFIPHIHRLWLENLLATSEDSQKTSAEKHLISSQLQRLPGVAIEHLTKKLMDLGLSHTADGFQLIRSVLLQWIP